MVTIIGIPLGKQCFKLGRLALWPFGQPVHKEESEGRSEFWYIAWLIFMGIEAAVYYISLGMLLCCTIIGIPLGLKKFKMIPIVLSPFNVHIGAAAVAMKEKQGKRDASRKARHSRKSWRSV